MVKYVIGKCFSYWGDCSTIELSNNPFFDLNDNELIEYIADCLLHEHIHIILHKLFNYTVSALFDGIEHFFRSDARTTCEKKMKNNPKYKLTWQEYIESCGFSVLLKYYKLDYNDIKQANILCSKC
jgi:hypothetical protein